MGVEALSPVRASSDDPATKNDAAVGNHGSEHRRRRPKQTNPSRLLNFKYVRFAMLRGCSDACASVIVVLRTKGRISRPLVQMTAFVMFMFESA